jgi:hypothetical protein
MTSGILTYSILSLEMASVKFLSPSLTFPPIYTPYQIPLNIPVNLSTNQGSQFWSELPTTDGFSVRFFGGDYMSRSVILSMRPELILSNLGEEATFKLAADTRSQVATASAKGEVGN